MCQERKNVLYDMSDYKILVHIIVLNKSLENICGNIETYNSSEKVSRSVGEDGQRL